jgi:hypothetical protein
MLQLVCFSNWKGKLTSDGKVFIASRGRLPTPFRLIVEHVEFKLVERRMI